MKAILRILLRLLRISAGVRAHSGPRHAQHWTSSVNPAVFRDLFDVAEMLGKRAAPGGVLTINTGAYVVHAATDDRITHLADLYVRSQDDLAIRFRCRPLIIDGYGAALSHLRQPEVLVDCMTCLVRGLGR